MVNQRIIQGMHSLPQIAHVPEFANCQRIFAVIDPTAFQASGADEVLAPLWAEKQVLTFSQFAPNPQLEEVQVGIEQFFQTQPELIIALGGGTAIDMAKLIRALSTSQNPRNVLTGEEELSPPEIPLIAIPTTSGTGSEATQFAVVYVAGLKHSLDHPSILPEIALLDPALTMALPSAITAATGLDAFCQAIESIWAVGASPQSLDIACEAASLIYSHLPRAVHTPDEQSRIAMNQASHLAGRAINITRTTACHALSYSLTSRYGLPHGIAVAVTLAPLLRFNAAVQEEDCADSRGVQSVRKRIELILRILNASDVPDACQRIRDFLQGLNCPSSLTEAGISSPAQIEQLIRSVNLQRLANNPRRTTSDSLQQLLTESPETATTSC